MIKMVRPVESDDPAMLLKMLLVVLFLAQAFILNLSWRPIWLEVASARLSRENGDFRVNLPRAAKGFRIFLNGAEILVDRKNAKIVVSTKRCLPPGEQILSLTPQFLR